MNKYDVLSIVFYPQVVTFLTFLSVILYLHLSLLSLLVITFFYSIMPSLIIYVMLKLGLITDIHVSKREQRAVPITLSIISFVIGLLLVSDSFLFVVLLLYTINTTLILLISLKFKISVHVSTAVGAITLLFFVFGVLSLPLYSLGVLISFVRYKMRAHTLCQVISAWIFAPLTYIELYLAFHTLFYVRT